MIYIYLCDGDYLYFVFSFNIDNQFDVYIKKMLKYEIENENYIFFIVFF